MTHTPGRALVATVIKADRKVRGIRTPRKQKRFSTVANGSKRFSLGGVHVLCMRQAYSTTHQGQTGVASPGTATATATSATSTAAVAMITATTACNTARTCSSTNKSQRKCNQSSNSQRNSKSSNRSKATVATTEITCIRCYLAQVFVCRYYLAAMYL